MSMFGSIGKVIAAASGKVGGGSLNAEITQAISRGALTNPLGASVQNLVSGAINNIEGILGSTEKAMYIAALHAAIDKATTQHHFNIETATNDLWIRLTNIKSHKPQIGQLAEKIQRDQGLMGELQMILDAQQRIQKSIINNMP